MKGLLKVLLVAMLVLAMSIPALAVTKVTVNGQVRFRQMFDDRDRMFDTTAAMDQYGELRTRVGIRADVNENAFAFVQFQDSRVTGYPASGDLSSRMNVDLHQGYIQVNNIFNNGWGFKAGRFEFNAGNQRVFGAVGWDNVGRSWEGCQGWWDQPDFVITGMWLKSVENRKYTYNQDYDIFGLYSTIKKINLDLFAFWEHNADTSGLTTGVNKLDRYDLGMYYHRVYKEWDFTMNGVYQLGKMPSTFPMDTTEMDIAAFLFTFEAGYTFPGSKNARIAAGIDYASGDDGKDSTKFKAYNNMYYTGHKFRGYMDFFLGSNMAGLMDIILRGSFDPAPGWTLKGDFHYFSTAQDYYGSVSNSMTKDVGMEIDLTLSTTRISGIKLVGGASLFLPQDDFAEMKDADPGFWGYTMAIMDF